MSKKQKVDRKVTEFDDQNKFFIRSYTGSDEDWGNLRDNYKIIIDKGTDQA